MSAASPCPRDFRLVFHDSLSDSYEMSQVLLASADFDGTLQLLTSGWERALGYGRDELKGKTLTDLLWPDRRGAARTVAAILDPLSTDAVELRVRCRSGAGLVPTPLLIFSLAINGHGSMCLSACSVC